MDQIVKFKSDHVKIEVASHFPHFWSQFSTDFDVTPLKSKLRTSSTRTCSDHATMMPIRGPKMAKNADIGNFQSIFFWHFNPFRGVLSLQNLAYLVEEVLSFEMSSVTSKSVKNWLQEWRKSDSLLCGGMGFLPLITAEYGITTSCSWKLDPGEGEVGRVRYTHPWKHLIIGSPYPPTLLFVNKPHVFKGSRYPPRDKIC